MILRLANLGPIEQAEIHIDKPLTVLVGANNTGKTYVSYCLYGARKISMRNPEAFKAFIEPFINRLAEESDFVIDFQNDIAPQLPAFSEIFSKELQTALPELFGANISHFEEAKVSIELDFESIRMNSTTPKLAISNGRFPFGEIQFQKNGFNKNTLAIGASLREGENKEALINTPGVLRFFANSFRNLIFFPNNTYFALAERNAVNLFANYILGNLDKNESIYTDSTFPLPLKDNLIQTLQNKLFVERKSKLEFSEIAVFLEDKLLKGKISLDKEGAVNYHLKQKIGDSVLPLQLSASIIKSLAGIVVFLKHSAKLGDYVLIDEPELNLHPNNQRLVAQAVVRMINAGLHVVVSTHSDYFIKELNILMHLHQISQSASKKALDKKGNLKEYPYEKSDYLNADDMRVYLFKDNTVVELPITPFGIEVNTIDEQINNQNALLMKSLRESAQSLKMN